MGLKFRAVGSHLIWEIWLINAWGHRVVWRQNETISNDCPPEKANQQVPVEFEINILKLFFQRLVKHLIWKTGIPLALKIWLVESVIL